MHLFVSIFLVFILNTGIIRPQPRSSQTVAHSPEYIECPLSEFCSNGGTCYMEVNKRYPMYFCKCPDKTYGETCEFRATYQAKLCQSDLADHFCVNGGACYEDSGMNETIYYCECPRKFWGARCESISPGKIQLCSPTVSQILCRNGGTCYESTMDDVTYEFCACAEEYIGHDCGFKIVEDNSSVIVNELLCLNEGACNRAMWKDVEIFGCSCQQGFSGDRCEYSTLATSSLCSGKDLDFCFNGGTCYEELSSSKKVLFCSCVTGYTGQRCEISLSTDPQECEYLEHTFCANGGTCFVVHYMGITLHFCECTMQFGGTRCEKKLPREKTCPPPLDEETCENNGTCLSIDTGKEQGAYMCKCAEGYYGATCEYRQIPFVTMHSECPVEILEFLCLNGGTCYKDIIMNLPFYYCECLKPFHGVRCERKIIEWLPCPPPLDTDLCLRGGVCSQVATHFPSLYFCQCKEETFGARCEHCLHGVQIEDHPCQAPLDKLLCNNGGTCVAVKLNRLVTTFFCSCSEGFYGMSCEYPYSTLAIKDICPSEMEKTLCLNGGTCYKENIYSYTIYVCECVYPYTGERCELMSIQKYNCPHEFNNILCLNGGSCTYRKSNGYTVYLCECTEQYVGSRCEHKFRSDSDRVCPEGFKNELCKNGGVCVTAKLFLTSFSIYYCKCVAGFFGVSCEYPHSSIESTSVLCPSVISDTYRYCEHGGTCYASRLTGKPVYYCLCPDGYHGITCEFEYPPTKCPQNIAQFLCLHGTCFQHQSNGVDTYQCVCHQGYYGDRCERGERGSPCAPPFSTDLCKNGGICVRIIPQPALILYYCKCPQGFYGTACEYPYHPGLEKHEVCRLDVAQSYCLNGGTCYRKEIKGQLVSFCECVTPYYGARCEYNLAFNAKCLYPINYLLCIQGTCVPQISHGQTVYSCLCLEGYYGSRCEHKQEEISHYEPCPHPLENNLCGNGGSCVVTILKENRKLYFCKCTEEYYGISCEYMKPQAMKQDCPAEIARDWCLHGGSCFAEYTMNRIVFRCECISPFYGERCEKHPFIQLYCPRSMQKKLCYNGGSCIESTVGEFTVYYCKCMNGYYGSRCEFCKPKEDVCPSHLNTDLCKNGGTCLIFEGAHGENIYHCKCPEGLYGVSCEYPYHHLATVGRPCPTCLNEHYCLHGGTCYREDIMGNSVYHCECLYPFHGEQCEVKYPQQLTCPNQFNYFLCLNKGRCVQTTSNGHIIYTCMCQDGYYGPRCEHTCGDIENPTELCEDPFRTELCKNGGTCVSLKFPGRNELLFCKCRPGTFGTGCEYPFLPVLEESSVCPPDVAKYFCLNGGTCYIGKEDAFYYCQCPDTYFGERCELHSVGQMICPSLPFDMELCLNGGTCVQHHINSYHIFMCQCTEGYYGPRCEYYKHREDTCPSPIDKVLCMNGGTCTALLTEKDQHIYFCVCPDGYYGMICEHKIPPAPSEGVHCPPLLANYWCLNGGTCYLVFVMGIRIYYCICVEPFYGTRCELESPGLLPCPHLLDKFLCINGGVCTKRMLHRPSRVLYYCDCPLGYSGARCEMTALIERKVKYCYQFKWFCENGGVCLQEVVSGIMHCDCKYGYYGERCHLKTIGPVTCPPEYEGHICFNGGTCMIGSTLLRKTVYCECQAGYLGQRCEFTEPKTKPSCPSEIGEFLCLNGGTCLEETINKQQLYYCECPEQNFGLRCEYNSPEGGSCELELDEYFCLNGGTCYSFKFSGHTVYYCACDSGYHGSLCQYPMQEPVLETLCSPEIAEWFCYNGGTCFQGIVNGNSDYYCTCLTGMVGHRCEYIEDTATGCPARVEPVFCNNHGTCKMVFDTSVIHFYFCVCPEGYGGRRCDYVNHRIDKCPVSLETSLCLNGGNCRILIFVGHIIYYCECPKGFYGPRCQHTLPSPIEEQTCPENIDQHFCLNGGTCRQTYSQKLVINYCICVEGYWGERCEYSYSDQTNCSKSFDMYYCLNGGTCYQLTVGKETFYHCQCLKNFFGPRCESQYPLPGPEAERCVGEIDTYFCLNNGTCYQIVVNNEVFYFCLCPEGWTGLRCEDGPVTKQYCPPELAEEYCLNNGTCVKLQVGIQELYYCRCARGFEGTRCEYNLPSGSSKPCSAVLSEMYCLNGGTCSEMTVLEEKFYLCDCPERFWGKQCEFSTFIRNFCPPMLDFSFCLNGGTCYQVLVDDKDLYYCVCTNIYYGMRCENSYIESREWQPCQPHVSKEVCLNGGSCFELNKHGRTVYYCECAEGYSGTRCEHENVGYLHLSYLNMQHNLERNSSSMQANICFFLLSLWFTLCYKTIF